MSLDSEKERLFIEGMREGMARMETLMTTNKSEDGKIKGKVRIVDVKKRMKEADRPKEHKMYA